MIFDDARAAIAAYIQTAWTAQFPDYPLQFENIEQIDLATQANPFCNVFIKYHDSHQMDMNQNPRWRYHGYLHCEAFVKEATGTKTANQMIGFLARLLRGAMFNGITFQAGQPLTPVTAVGWFKQPILIKFYYDDI